jgi:excisionase family DNA binding protein
MIRPAEHLVHKGPVAVLDGRVCAMLNKLLGLDKIRSQVRGQNPQLDQALLAIQLAALATETSGSGSSPAPQPEVAPRSKQQLNTVSTTTAASSLGITDRAIRQAITEKRLTATKVDGRYRITPDDLATYAATR